MCSSAPGENGKGNHSQGSCHKLTARWHVKSSKISRDVITRLLFSKPAEGPERRVYPNNVCDARAGLAYPCWETKARTRWTSRCKCWKPARTASSWCFRLPCGASSCSSPRSSPSAPSGSAAARRAPAGSRRTGDEFRQSGGVRRR